jgi:hypothetical protein
LRALGPDIDCQNPSFVYAEDEGDYSFDIRFAPVEEETHKLDPMIKSPSDPDRSPDPLLVTPATPISTQTPFEAAPLASPSWTSLPEAARADGPRVKEEEVGDRDQGRAEENRVKVEGRLQEMLSGEPPRQKKKARVAFA